MFVPLFLLLLPVALCQLQVVPRRLAPPNQNRIVLLCRRQTDNGIISVTNAQFWLNEVTQAQNLREILDDDEISAPSSSEILFTITRDLEGTYFCGENVLESSGVEGSVRLIAYPSLTVPLIPPNERVFFAEAGSTARIDCSVLPGALLEQYYVDWRNATSMVEVARVTGPRNFLPGSTQDPRFRVDNRTFSLLIDSVQLSDEGFYQCVLGVRETVPNGQLLVYTRTEFVNLELVVYQAPVITEPPRQTIVPFDPNNSVSFECEVRGDPLPEVEWYHQGMEVENDDSSEGKYEVITTYSETDAGDFIVHSQLIINNVDALDAGEVRCAAMAMDEELPMELPTAEASAQLIVISNIDNLSVLVTTTGDIIFQLKLPKSILVPVQLRVRYLQPSGDEIARQVTSSGYNNTHFITHFEPEAGIPLAARNARNFKVSIALFYRRHQGPFITTSDVVDLQIPTVFTEEEASVTRTIIISVLVSVVIVALLIAVLVPVLVVVISRTRLRRKKANYTQSLEQRESDHRLALEAKHEQNQMRLEALEQQHNADLLDKEQKYEAGLKQLREEKKSELDQMRLEHQSQLQRLQEKNENDWKKLTEGNKHDREMKALEVLEEFTKQKPCRIQVKIGDVAFHVETESDYEALDEIDAPSSNHSHFLAHSEKRPLLKRGASIDYHRQDEKCVMGYMKTMFRASIRDPKLGPEIKKYIATEMN